MMISKLNSFKARPLSDGQLYAYVENNTNFLLKILFLHVTALST